MKELFKNKLFIIISLFIILVTFISSNCFASASFNITNTEGTIYSTYIDTSCFDENNEVCNYYVIIQSINNPDYFYIYASSSPMTFNVKNDRPYNPSSESNIYLNWTTAKSSDDYDYNIVFTPSLKDTSAYYSIKDIVYSNYDVYDTSNNLLFQAAPPVIPVEVEQVTIPAIQQVGEIPQGMNQVLQVIIPIGLIVLSIGLVVYLMRLVIYRMK